MGLSEVEVQSLSLLELFALFERHQQNERRRDYRAGVIAAAIYNVNRDPKKHPDLIDPMLFFGSQKQAGPRVLDAEDARSEFEGMNAFLASK